MKTMLFLAMTASLVLETVVADITGGGAFKLLSSRRYVLDNEVALAELKTCGDSP